MGVALLAGSGAWADPPRRVVSLNPCLDAIVMAVADPAQITALSRYSADPAEFALADEARRYRHIGGDAEAVALLRPDLVLLPGLGAAPLEAVLPRLHIRFAAFMAPDTIDASLAQVRQVAALVGHPERGEAVVAQIREALARAAPRPGELRLSALVFEAQGFVSGPHTLADELLTRTGFDNPAPRYGLTRSGDLPLERLVADPPQVLLAGRLGPGEPDWADRILSHPALASLRGRMRRESFPEPLLFCAGPVLIPAAEALARARQDAEAHAR